MLSFESFKNQVNTKLYKDDDFKGAAFLLIDRYGVTKVDYYFNQININRDDFFNYERKQDNETPLNFELVDVMEHCENN